MSTANIMIVEDEYIVAADLKSNLENMGYQVCHLATTGEDAISQAENLRPDLVLMDIFLGTEMDGVVAAREIHSRFHIPIVFVTSYADEATLERAKVAEPFGYLLKPFDYKELNSTIEMSLYKGIMEQKLRQSEQRFRAIAHYTYDWESWQGPDGRLLWVNPAVERVTGYTPEECMAMSDYPLLLIHEDDRERMKEILSAAMTTRNIGNDLSFKLCRKDGSARWAAISWLPIYDDGCNWLGLRSSIRDITDRRQAAVEREALISKLELKNEELEQFTYAVSHDLKSPLITIRGFIRLLENEIRSFLSPKCKQYLTHIADAAQKLDQLVDELLELSRLGCLAHCPTSLAFEDLARDALGMLQGRIAERKARVEIEADMPNIYADPSRLRQVLENLIDNAIKFMGDQTDPRVHIGSRPSESGPIFYVRDNGIGIDPSYHEKIFGLFTRADHGTKGTGVGLAIVKRIIEMHGGRIWVESELGRGATLCFILPKEPEIQSDNSLKST